MELVQENAQGETFLFNRHNRQNYQINALSVLYYVGLILGNHECSVTFLDSSQM